MTTRILSRTGVAGLMLMLPLSAPHAQAPASTASAAQETPALKNANDKTSYAVGMNLGSAIRRDSADLDVDLIVRGLKDAFTGGTTLLTEAEMRAILTRLHAELKSKQKGAGTARATAGSATSHPGSMSRLVSIDVSFKLDPRITKGLYMGDRWVPPPYTQGGDDKQVTVEARAHGRDSSGKSLNASPKWVLAHADIATVTPGEGSQVTITVQRPGETTLRVTADGVSKELGIKAEKQGAALRVVISAKG